LHFNRNPIADEMKRMRQQMEYLQAELVSARGGIGSDDVQVNKCLCAQLLRAKYYPGGEIIDTIFAGEASPSWRGMEHGLELLKKGIIWRVGRGTKIQIWRDPWIPRPPSLKNNLKKGERSRLRWVSQLMVPGQCEWHMQSLNSYFYRHDIEEIRKIRLSDTGMFTVRSAYKIALQHEQEEQRQVGSSIRADGQ
jgi:hypothetical protein